MISEGMIISPSVPGLYTSSHLSGSTNGCSCALAVPSKPAIDTAGSNAASSQYIFMLVTFLMGNSPGSLNFSKTRCYNTLKILTDC